MSDQTVYQYVVYCIEEDTDVTQWSVDPPTLCPNNHNDRTIDQTKTRITSQISQKIVKVNEPTDGYFEANGLTFDIPAGNPGDEHILMTNWPMDILIWRTQLVALPNNVGDSFSIIGAPDTIIGITTDNAIIGATTLVVSPTVLPNIVKGLDLSIDDGTNYQKLGRVTGIDNTLSTITVENALINPYTLGAFIKLNVYMIRNYFISSNRLISFGDKGFRGKILPAGVNMKLIYKNMDGQAKKVDWHVEFYIQ